MDTLLRYRLLMFFARPAQYPAAIANQLIRDDFAIHIKTSIIERAFQGCEFG